MTARAGGAALRRQIRQQRRSMDAEQRRLADSSIRMHIRHSSVWRSARRVAMFFAFDGEPDLGPLRNFHQGKAFFVPVIAGPDIRFARIDGDSTLIPNRFGIPEPTDLTLIDPRSLDLVLTPLVAFDDAGNRLGVGAGFYDRCFAFLAQRRHWHRPKLLGTAYSLQRVAKLDPQSWDVPLWGAVTENGLARFDG